jgi:hypothetical protein
VLFMKMSVSLYGANKLTEGICRMIVNWLPHEINDTIILEFVLIIL